MNLRLSKSAFFILFSTVATYGSICVADTYGDTAQFFFCFGALALSFFAARRFCLRTTDGMYSFAAFLLMSLSEVLIFHILHGSDPWVLLSALAVPPLFLFVAHSVMISPVLVLFSYAFFMFNPLMVTVSGAELYLFALVVLFFFYLLYLLYVNKPAGLSRYVTFILLTVAPAVSFEASLAYLLVMIMLLVLAYAKGPKSARVRKPELALFTGYLAVLVMQLYTSGVPQYEVIKAWDILSLFMVLGRSGTGLLPILVSGVIAVSFLLGIRDAMGQNKVHFRYVCFSAVFLAIAWLVFGFAHGGLLLFPPVMLMSAAGWVRVYNKLNRNMWTSLAGIYLVLLVAALMATALI